MTNVIKNQNKSDQKLYTKKGLPRKRKLFEESLSERKKQKVEEKAESHQVKLPCNPKCRLKCPQKLKFDRQEYINTQFWKMSNLEQRTFVFSCTKKCAKQRQTTLNSRRENSFKYVLKREDGVEVFVCKTFLLATLGFSAANDRLLKSVRDTEATAVLPKKTCAAITLM